MIRNICIFLSVWLVQNCCVHAQTPIIDSLIRSLVNDKQDTSRVWTFGKLAFAYYYYHPDSTFYFANQGMLLSRDLHFKKGEAYSLVTMGSGLSQTGNYAKALDLIVSGLKINEEIKDQEGISSAFESLADVYGEESDYRKSIEYYFKQLSVVQSGEEKKRILGNIGATYGEMDKLDSALYYLNIRYEDNVKMNNRRGLAFSQINLAEVYVKMKMDKLALEYYRLAIPVITEMKVNEALCETTFYMAGIFQRQNQDDSAIYYGLQSLALANRYFYTSRQLKANEFLASFYQSKNNSDSTLKYLKSTISLKDSLFNQEKSKEIENLTFGENIRQQEIVAQKKQAEDDHSRNLQFFAIGVFIPFFFIGVLLLSRTTVKPRVVEFLGILSLLLFFEFITDLIYPYVSDLTNDNPIWEMLCLVILAAVVEPLNFKLEHWVKGHLVRKPIHLPVPLRGESISNDPESQHEV